MKTTTLAVIFCLILSAQSAIGQTSTGKGMQFFNGTWSELLHAARKQNKLIFLDVYTDWCGPCKLMDKNIFPQEKAGSKYNPLFLNYKVNAEKGEGIEIAKRFNVSVFPTFLFLNSSGYLLRREMGERELDPFVSLADQAVKDAADKNNPGNLEAQFKSGVRTPEFLRGYISRLHELDMDNSEALDEYFKSLSFTDINKEESLVFFGQNFVNARSATLMFFINNYDKLSKESKDKVADNVYQKLIVRAAPLALTSKSGLEFKQLMTFADKLEKLDNNKRYFMNRLRLLYADLIRDNKQVIATGYVLNAGLADISIDSIRAEDARQYKTIMQPFLSGEKDSTAIPGFADEVKLVKKVYTREIGSKLYMVAQIFARLPDTEVQALKDALAWMRKCSLLEPDMKPYTELAAQLEKRVRSL